MTDRLPQDDRPIGWWELLASRLDPRTLAEMTAMSRRSALKLMGASLAVALGVPGCRRKPERKIVSRIDGPEYQHPGEPLQYSSTWTEGPHPYGMLVEAIDGRPVKIEGNPSHPINGEASSAAMQASIYSLYDPDRLTAPLRSGQPIPWPQADAEILAALRSAKRTALITRATLGPSERAMVERFIQAAPGARHFVHEPAFDASRRAAWQTVFGQPGELVPQFDRAKVIVSLGSDFLGTDGAVLANIRQFSSRRALVDQAPTELSMPRLYVVESGLTVTGAAADHRLRARPSELATLARYIRAGLRTDTPSTGFVATMIDDLREARGEALVLAGPQLGADVHALVALINRELDAYGRTLAWNPSPPTLPPTDRSEIESYLADGVDVLIVLGTNPVFDWPTPRIRSLIEGATLSVGQGLYLDETLAACTFALPASHNLESWNDASPNPAVHSVCQPVIAPLHASRQEAESLLLWTKVLAPDDPELTDLRDWHDFVRLQWQRRLFPDAADFEDRWIESLRTGVVLRPAEPPVPPMDVAAAERLIATGSLTSGELELVIAPHHAIRDGRFANNGWLQELPDPISKLVWDNAAAVSPATAQRFDLAEGDVVELRAGEGVVEIPILLQPGTADGVIVVTLGYGRTRAGRVGNAVGVNVAPLVQPGPTPWLASNVYLRKLNRRYPLVRTQEHASMEDRPIVLAGTLSEFRDHPDFVEHLHYEHPKADIYPEYNWQGPQWAMAIDQTLCIGCGACVIACQAENNIPVVGKLECEHSRNMHWLRIHRYYVGDPENPRVYHQPMPCQHCENAPCENVCPVNATTHDLEGLNQMVYNRCIGTRYCSNNCPYKVRRFNFFDYQRRLLRAPVQELAYNPNVTVRSVGVMEKCTFCIQRINQAKFAAKNNNVPIPDGAVKTACQQACPAGAIVFGDLADPASVVRRWHASGRAYKLLAVLNTQPRVDYLARIRNPHPALASSQGGHG